MNQLYHHQRSLRQTLTKSIRGAFPFLFALLLSPTLLSAQELTTMGIDFWVAIMDNSQTNDADSYYITASGPRACSVTVSNPNSSWSHTMSVAAGSLTTYLLPNAQCWEAGSCVITNKGLHVTATDSVQLWVFNSSGTPSACDATHILPLQALGRNYIVQTATVDGCYRPESRAQFSVLATEDSTTIDIVLSSATSTGIPAGSTLTQTLNAGQVYQVQSPQQIGDFSGTTVTSRDCKPIAVFSGATSSNIPNSFNTSADHLYQQNLPKEVFSTEWILTPSAWHDTTDYVRVTSSANNCLITLNGNTLTTINMGETYEFQLTTASYITTSQPAVVYQYLDSRHASNNGGDWGDASMFAPNPLNQRSKSCTFPCYHVRSRYPYNNKYYVNIVVPTAETSMITLDGNTVSGFTSITGTNYSYVRKTITESAHTLSTTGTGFIAQTYGLGENWEAYIITLGGSDTSFHAFSPMTITIDTGSCSSTFQWRDTTFAVPSHDTISRCEGTFIFNISLNPSFSDTIDTAFCSDTLRWGDTLLTVPGSYTFSYTTTEGCDSIIQLNLTKYVSYTDTIDTISCYNTFIWDDTTLTVPGVHAIHYTATDGCDSIIYLNVSLLDGNDTTLYIGSCDTLLLWQDSTYAVPGEHNVYFTALNGCDSIVHLTLTQYPSYELYNTVYIEEGEPYITSNGQTYYGGSQYDDTLLSIHGCDSILHTTIISNACTPKIWAPNVFTPLDNSNNIFKVESKNVSKMTVYIYQRWGDWVCTFDGLTEGWDGTKDGKPCKESAYVYLIRYETPCLANPKPIVGTVTIIH